MSAFDETFDWVVVGSGAGAMSSALVMLDQGKSVAILEKTDFLGGTTAKSGGVMWIPNNRFMRQEGEEDSTEAAMQYLDALQALDGGDAPGTSREKQLAYVEQAPRMLDFYVEQGMEMDRGERLWPDYYDEQPGGCKTTRTVVAKPFNLKELGALRKKLRKGFAEFNVTLSEGMRAQGHTRTNPETKKLLGKIVLRTIKDKLLGRAYTTAGAALQGRLLKIIAARGAVLRTQCPVKELIIENERAVGVVVTQNGQTKRIGAKLGVLVNAGGFAHNQQMRDQYIPGSRAEWTQTAEGDTGDMHKELERIGGQLAQMDQMVGYQMTPAPGWQDMYVAPGAQSSTGKPHAILVDQSGERYMSEGGSYELFCENILKRNRTVPAIPSYGIADSQYTALYQIAGKWVDKKIPDGWLEAGYLHTADTLEDLASQLGIEPATLRATVDRWNGFVRAGKDEDFQRGEREYDKCGFVGDPFSKASSLGTVEKGPFYSFPVVPADVSTYGGVIADARGRVVKADGAVISGLYATGVTTASVMGNVYVGAGSSIGPSAVFGYIAARDAAGLDNQ